MIARLGLPQSPAHFGRALGEVPILGITADCLIWYDIAAIYARHTPNQEGSERSTASHAAPSGATLVKK